MFVVVIFHLFYVLAKICVVFVVLLNVNVIPVKYGRELTLTRYMPPLHSHNLVEGDFKTQVI